MSTLHCALENGTDLYVNKHQKIQHCRARSTEEKKKKKEEEKEEEEECQMAIFTSRGAYVNCTIIPMLYTYSIGNQPIEHDGGI